MKTFSIALKDLQIMIRDRGAVFQLFILPLLFILVFSGALSSLGRSEDLVLLIDLNDYKYPTIVFKFNLSSWAKPR
jgi:hypothetical protein